MPHQLVEIETLVERLVHLEQKVGHKAQYPVMPPLAGPFKDVHSLQSAAKKISEFIGLHNFNFKIAVVRQKANVGGCIHLSDAGNVVSVEVDPDMLRFPDVVAATLCHEICHKYLHVNGIEIPIEIDNEILTDVTSVFLGFGKVMLNGQETIYVTHERLINGTRTLTEARSSGYLDRDELAFVYRLVCAMRNIPSADYMQGLNAEAALAVRRCDSLNGDQYRLDFHRKGTAAEIATTLRNQVLPAQRAMAEVHKHSTFIKRSLCVTLDDCFVRGSRTFESILRSTAVMTEGIEHDPALRFLWVIKSNLELKRLREEVDAVSKETDALLSHARTVSLGISQNHQQFPVPAAAMFTIVVCPIDGTTLRLPENSEVILSCPNCKYRFAYNTTIASFSAPDKPRTLTWWQSIRTLMKRPRTG
jgi:hypothetical protein